MSQIPSIFEQAEMLIPPFPWDKPRTHRADGEKVVLIHGLWRGFHAMEPLARRLQSAGYSTLNLPYPSSRKPIDWIVPRLRSQIEEFAEGDQVHLVTHSLGGILARAMLSAPPPWKVGKLVMIAPPNGGSEIVDWAQNKRLFLAFLGPAGRELGTDGVPLKLPQLPAGLEAAVIMGRKSKINFFHKVLQPENDGVVSVEYGKIEGLKGFTVVDGDHTFIQIHPDTIRQVLHFLKEGTLQKEIA
ncbi:alpha/beta hydrolase [Luteolibacter pohnpeiensis]|uniref:Alpha/beta hydrolase n=1 Tax=Luteolibacter pohnpeiensis TaxID=454153 RepID=A0A934S5R2_9BACT|nr:alpha/beta hydrolase [Luteolibacter pohnpeiensis]MBK1881760.1 alpha/beta hydrolase [Luteolibacter pohnpeiensis]